MLIYSNKPSKQHKQKAFQLIKQWMNRSSSKIQISKQNKVNSSNLKQDEFPKEIKSTRETNISSQTSIRQHFSSQLNNFTRELLKVKEKSTNSILQKEKVRKINPQILETKNKLINKNKQFNNSLHSYLYQSDKIIKPSLQRSYKKQNKISNKLIQSTSNLNQSTNKLSQLTNKLTQSTNKLIQSQNNQRPLIQNQRVIIQKKLYEHIQKLKSQVQNKGQELKLARKQFVTVFESSKQISPSLTNQHKSIDIQINNLQEDLQIMSKQLMNRQNQKQYLKITLLSQIKQHQAAELQQLKQTKSIKKQIHQKVLTNSLITRQIYQKKLLLKSLNQTKQRYFKQQQNKKSYLKQIKSIKLKNQQLKLKTSQFQSRHQQQLLKQIYQQINNQDKQRIYQDLKKQLDILIKLFKFSSDPKSFKQLIKKQTNFQIYQKQVRRFLKSKRFDNQILQLYNRNIQNRQLKRILQSQNKYIQSQRILKLKQQIKALDIKKQFFNNNLKQKQKIILSLTQRIQKISQQIHILLRDTQNDQQSQSSEQQSDSF